LPFYFTTWYQSIFVLCCDLLKFLAAAFWWLHSLISLAVFLFDCFLAALFHHHGCGDVVLGIFGGSLLGHLCLVVGVCCLYSGIMISLFHLSKILIPDLFCLLCIPLILVWFHQMLWPPATFWVDSQSNLFSLRCFSYLGIWWLLLLLPLVSVVGSTPSTLSSWLLVQRLQHSRLGCWFIAFNNLVLALKALGVLSIILVYIFQA
jgi:hypothetical protein